LSFEQDTLWPKVFNDLTVLKDVNETYDEGLVVTGTKIWHHNDKTINSGLTMRLDNNRNLL